MQRLNLEDHDTYWADNEHMRDLTKAYQQRAQDIIANGFFETDTRHPWMKHGFDINAQVQIYEFEGDHIGPEQEPIQTDDVRDMLMHWENTPKDGTAKTNRRVILLNDMHPRVIELLGVLLDIPPQFFLAHCDEFVDLSVVDGACAKQGSSVYWRVPVPRRRGVPGHIDKGVYYVEAGNFNRQEINAFNCIEDVSLHSLVSCWSKSYGEDSWTVVMLVDPDETYLRPKVKNPDQSSSRILLPHFDPHRDIHHEVVVGSTEGLGTKPYKRSIYDVAAAAYGSEKINVTEDPFTATVLVRNLIRSCWEERILRESIFLSNLLVYDTRAHQDRRGSMATQNPKRTKGVSQDVMAIHAYEQLMDRRGFIREDREALDSIMWKFRCKYQEPTDSVPREEANAWRFLVEKVDLMESTIGKHMDMWSQRAGLEQVAAANRSARTSGQLTKLAAVIVPCSFVASIFSMGGKFAAGEDLFFVYWVISLPATIALLIWVLYEHIPELKPVRNRKRKSRTSNGGKIEELDEEALDEESGTSMKSKRSGRSINLAGLMQRRPTTDEEKN